MTGPKQYIPGNLVALDINKQALEPLVFKRELKTHFFRIAFKNFL
jgi:hypothetical protein